jgi:tetratricopeptide (TPR) repeat protein
VGAPRRYIDFPLELRRWTADGFESAVPLSDVGETEPVHVPLTQGELDFDLLTLERGTASADDAIAFGRRLADLLLPEGEIRRLFAGALARARREDAGVRLRLIIRANALMMLPWELAYLPPRPGEASARHFLALDPLVSIVRHPPLGEQRPSLEPVDPSRLRLVACTAQAQPYVPLDLERERQAIDQAFAGFCVPGVEIQREFVTDATFGRLTEQLGQRADLFHFGGHGVWQSDQIDPASGLPMGKGSIVLRGEDGKAQLVGAASLALELRRGGVRVCVLGACDAGRQDGVSPWSGIAPALIEEGVAAVVGMQFRIADRAAISFGEAFYRELARGVSVDEAVSTARLAAFHLDENGWQWAVPVLYMRAVDAFIFPVGPSPVPPEAPALATAAPLPARVRGTRPLAYLTGVFDRQAEQLELGRHLADPSVRVVTVVGREGMGKSAIVSAVMAGLEHDRWPDGETRIHVDGIAYFSARDPAFSIDRLFVECAALLGSETADSLERVWANESLPASERWEHLLRGLASGYRVIVLDDAEVLVSEDGAIKDDRVRTIFGTVLLSPSPVHVIVVSRRASTLGGQAQAARRIIEVAEGLPVAEAMVMLRATDPDDKLGIRDAPDDIVRDAVVKVGRVPRAIELIATMLETQPLSSLASVVAAFFSDEVVTRDLIEETYAQLDPDDRRVIEALAVYRAPVPLKAIAQLLAPVAPELDIPAAIVRLVRAHLVIADRVSQTVAASAIDQAYAYGHLPADGPMSPRAAEARAAEYFKTQRKEKHGWKQITDLDPHMREFEHRLRADDPDGASAALATIEEHMAWQGNAELAKWQRSRLEGQLSDPQQKARHAYGLGHVRVVLGPLSEALAHFEEAHRLARAVPDPRLEALALGWTAETNRRLGRLEESVAQFRQAIPALDAFDDMADHATRLRLVHGLTESYLGNGAAALEVGQHILAGSGDSRRNQGRAHDCLSLAYLVLGRLDEADEHADLAIAAYTEVEDLESMAYVENVKGMVLAGRGQMEEALDRFEATERSGAEAQQPRIVGLARFNRARAYRMLSQADKALIVARNAEEALGAIGASEQGAATALRKALEAAASVRSSAETELTELLACARASSRSADVQPPHDLGDEVESRARENGLETLAAEAAALAVELQARLEVLA